MREQLIRYLLGELDADERRDLQSRLKSSPELRAELEQLRSCFAASQDEDLFAPDAPSGLAARTAGRVAGDDAKQFAERQARGPAIACGRCACRALGLEPCGFDGCRRRDAGGEHAHLSGAAK